MKKFRKTIGFVFFTLVILFVIGSIAGFIFLKNFDIAKYKPQIIKLASQSLGRPVDFKDIALTVSLKEGVRFHLSGLSVAENPEFGTESFLAADEIDARLDILAFTTTRQISLPNVLIRSPRINIVKNTKGIISAQTLGQAQQETSPKDSGGPVKAAALPAIFINSFKIENAQLNFIDQSVQPEQKSSITQLNLDVRNFSVTKPFDVALDGAILSSKTDLRVKGKVQLRLAKNEVKLTACEILVDLNQLSLEQLKGLSGLAGVPIPESIKGELKTEIKEAVFSDKGLGRLAMDVALTGGQVIAPNLAPGISLDVRHVDFALSNFSLNGSAPSRLTLTAALYQEETNVNFNGDVAVDLKTQEVGLTNGQLATDLTLWPLEKIQAAIAPLKTAQLPEHLAGKLQTTIKDLKVSPAGLKSILLDAQLTGGEVSLDNVISGASLSLTKTDVSIKDFSLTQPFFVSVKTAYLSGGQDISFEGNVSYDLKTLAANMKEAVLGLDLDSFSLESFKASGLLPKGVPFPTVLGGKFKTQIHSLTASAKGVEQMKVDLAWRDGKISIPELSPGISVTANSIDLKVKDFSLKDAFAVALSLGYESDVPNISFDGKMTFDQATQNIRLSQAEIKTDLSLIPLEHLKSTLAPLKTVPLPEVLKGKIAVLIKDLSAGPKGLISVNADADLKDGEVSMKDVSPGISFAVSQVNAAIKDFGLGTPFGFNLEMGYLHDAQNIKANGTATINMAEQRIQLKDTTLETDLSTFALEQLKASIASLQKASLPEKLQGVFKFTISEADAGTKGLVSLKSEGSLSGGAVKMKELTVPLQGLDTNFRLTEKDFTMDAIKANLGKGQITAQFGIKDYLTRQDFTLSAELKGIDLSEILDQKQAPVKMEGLASGNIKAQGQGADTNSITGNGNFEVQQAKLKDFNVLKTVLDKISFIPNVSSRIESNLPDKYKEKLNNKDTEINKIATVCTIANGQIVLDPVSIEADEFTFSGKSQATFDQQYTLDGAFKIPAELSAAMAQGATEMQYLFDNDKNISLPVHVAGKGGQAPGISVTQTAIDMGRNAVLNEGKKELEKVLNKALGGTDTTTSSGSQDQQTEGTTQDQTSPAADVVDSIFNKIFK